MSTGATHQLLRAASSVTGVTVDVRLGPAPTVPSVSAVAECYVYNAALATALTAYAAPGAYGTCPLAKQS